MKEEVAAVRQQKKPRVKKSPAKRKKDKKKPKKLHHDFVQELTDYLSAWESRHVSTQWKFSKIIQTWALENCFDKRKIDSKLFKHLLPYLITVQGVAVERLRVSRDVKYYYITLILLFFKFS